MSISFVEANVALISIAENIPNKLNMSNSCFTCETIHCKTLVCQMQEYQLFKAVEHKKLR